MSHHLPEGVLHFEESYRVYCTLVQGERLAILWDTGQGKLETLREFVENRVKTDYLVLNSHGHSDHIAGNHRFPKVYANRADCPLLGMQARMTTGEPPAYQVEELEPGAVFDLGGRHARVISLAGHTRGSVGLLLEEDRLLLAGDGLNTTLLLLGREAAPIDRLRQTLEETEALPFDRYLSSHAPNPLPKAQVGVHLRHLDNLHTEPPSRPGPYGPRVCRSLYRETGGRSTILFDRDLVLGGE